MPINFLLEHVKELLRIESLLDFGLETGKNSDYGFVDFLGCHHECNIVIEFNALVPCAIIIPPTIS